MEQVLDRLRAYIAANPTRAFFGAPASAEAVAAAERAIGRVLPKSYDFFLRAFNGGFISTAGTSDDEDWDIKTARWNSNHLFGTDHLVTEYNKFRKWTGGWEQVPFTPFCQTGFQELLVFGASAPGQEPPVLDAFHEAADWGVLYPDFPSLMRAYIDGEGRIDTIAKGTG